MLTHTHTQALANDLINYAVRCFVLLILPRKTPTRSVGCMCLLARVVYAFERHGGVRRLCAQVSPAIGYTAAMRTSVSQWSAAATVRVIYARKLVRNSVTNVLEYEGTSFRLFSASNVKKTHKHPPISFGCR